MHTPKTRMASLLLILIFIIPQCAASQEIPLYPKSIPNSKPTANEESRDSAGGILRLQKVTQPTLTIFLPPREKATGTAVVICPGGGYRILAINHEGYEIARRFNEMGVAAFVLKYRIPDSQTMLKKEIGPLQDAQQALALVRKNARKWHVDANRVGIMGFSAGGHLAATTGTNPAVITGKRVQKKSKPDFMVLVYPVISFMDSIGHMGSRDNLLGKNPSAAMKEKYSQEMQVNKNTPPAFLVHARDDRGVVVRNSTLYYEALQQHHIVKGIFLYDKGGHGFGMHNPTSNEQWLDKVQEWLHLNGWLKKK